jgi:general stress protein 26
MENNTQNKSSDREQGIKKLKELIGGIKIAMMATLNEDGTFHSRPMFTQQTDFDGDLWFFSGLHSGKTLELQHDSHICLSYSHPDNRFLSVSGRAEIVKDQAMSEKLWSPMYQAWFPGGLQDPNLSLIKVSVERAEFWDLASGKVVQLIGLVKALTTGKTYSAGPGEHGKVDLTG